MSETEQGPAGQTVTLARKLTSFYDEFAEFNDQSAFLCAALACVLADEDCHNERVARGAECWAFWMRQQMDGLQGKLRHLQKAAANDTPSRD